MRGKQAPKRNLSPDKVYNSTLVARLINYVMLDGKKATSQIQVYRAIEDSATKLKTKGIEGLEKAIENARPKIEVKSRRVGGSNFQVPIPVPEHRQTSLALRWIIAAARTGRGNKQFWESLSREIINAYKNEGGAIKKKDEVRRMADANKAFAQFA